MAGQIEMTIKWENIRFIVAEAIEQLAAGKGPPKLAEICNGLQPGHYVPWLHGFITAFVRVEKLDKKVIREFIKGCLDEAHKKGFLDDD